MNNKKKVKVNLSPSGPKSDFVLEKKNQTIQENEKLLNNIMNYDETTNIFSCVMAYHK